MPGWWSGMKPRGHKAPIPVPGYGWWITDPLPASTIPPSPLQSVLSSQQGPDQTLGRPCLSLSCPEKSPFPSPEGRRSSFPGRPHIVHPLPDTTALQTHPAHPHLRAFALTVPLPETPAHVGAWLTLAASTDPSHTCPRLLLCTFPHHEAGSLSLIPLDCQL